MRKIGIFFAYTAHCCIFAHEMRLLLLLFALLLSSFSEGGGSSASSCEQAILSARSASVSSEEGERSRANCYSTAILPAETVCFSEENAGAPLSLRPYDSSRRTHISAKSAFRLVKSGKIIDRNNSRTFVAALRLFPSGCRSFDRYIYSIRHLLI